VDGPKAEIQVEEGAEVGRVLSIRPDKVIDVGREGNFRLDDPALSRHHCKIAWDGESYRIEEVKATWGTFVNGVRIKAQVLQSGDRIKIGNHTLLFTVEEDESDIPMASSIAEEIDVPEADDDDIPSAGAVAPAAPVGRPPVRSSDPTVTPDPEPAEPEEVVPEGACGNCLKPAGNPVDPNQVPHPLGQPPRAYCTNCKEQYPLLGRVLANHLCDRVLGAGGMGIVYRGVHVVMGRKSALKTLRMLQDADPTHVKRLLREATAGGRIQHPNIVSVHDTGEQENMAYVVMEYVRGENLSEALRREKVFPVNRAVTMMTQVAEALASAFRLGYIHRDIKPENILLMRNDFVKVTDFGLAKNLKDGELGGLTRTGQVLGTMLYMPPEQIVSSKGSDQRADIYSLGATFFHLLSGRPVFDSKSAIALLMDIRTKNAPDITTLVPGVPPQVDQILQRCLKKKPEERYQTPDELVADLRAARASIS
jgi:hypothetical protein